MGQQDPGQLAALVVGQQRPGQVEDGPPWFVGVDAYIHAVNEHGDAVVFVPGELVPAWVAEQVNAGKAPLEEASAGVRTRRLERRQVKAKQ